MTKRVVTAIRCTRLCAVVFLLFFAATAARAQTATVGEGQTPGASHWQVHLAGGEVNWRRLPLTSGEALWHQVQSGVFLTPPAEIETAANARVELRRGDDRIRAGADTRLTLEDSPDSLFTRIRQAAGAVWYKVKSFGGRKFEVEGKYLVATIKGTEFEITLGPKGDVLSVTEGVVKASLRGGGGEAMDVAAGQSVLATAAGLVLLPAPDGGDRAPNPTRPEPAAPESTPNNNRTGDVHGVNGTGNHNHGGTKGVGVRDTHGEARSANGGGTKAQGPK